jgi:hypothetical protein
MAFTHTTLQRIGPQNSGAPTIWTYATTDALTAVDDSGYFSPTAAGTVSAAGMLQVGDWILVSSASTYGIHIVTSNTRDLTATPPVEGVVDVTNAVAFGAIDSN